MANLNILALNWQDLKNPMSGGAEVHLEELLRRVVSAGHRVTLVCSRFKGAAREETIEGIRIIRAGNRCNFNWVAPYCIRKLLHREKYDLFLEDVNKIPFYSPLYVRLPSIIIIPHLFSTAVFEEINFVLGSYIYLAERPITRVYRRKTFCVISESTAEDIISRGIPAHQVSVIHCGIDRKLYHNNGRFEKFDYPSVLYLGRIKKYKSVQHLIAAFEIVKEKIPQARLSVVGAGDYLPELQRVAESLGLKHTARFTGFVSEAEKVEYLSRAHVLVYPSLREGWGLTNIEANSCGTAVIAANSPGLRDSVRDGQSGLLYDYGDVAGLADKIITVLTDADLRKRLEQGGLEWAARFDWDQAAEKFLELCLRTAGKR